MYTHSSMQPSSPHFYHVPVSPWSSYCSHQLSGINHICGFTPPHKPPRTTMVRDSKVAWSVGQERSEQNYKTLLSPLTFVKWLAMDFLPSTYPVSPELMKTTFVLCALLQGVPKLYSIAFGSLWRRLSQIGNVQLHGQNLMCETKTGFLGAFLLYL